MYEIIPIIEHLHLKVKDSWEQARLIAWASTAIHLKNPKPLTEFMEFSWEKPEQEDVVENDISIEDLEKETKNIERLLNGKT